MLRSSSFREQPVVKVLVGLTEVTFFVYKNKLCNTSPWFKDALEKKSKGGIEDLVRLSGHEPDPFDHFVHWMYSGEIPLKPMELHGGEHKGAWLPFVHLFVLADELGVRRLQNDIIDIIRQTSRKIGRNPWGEAVKLATRRLSHKSGLRQLFSDLSAVSFSSDLEIVEDWWMRHETRAFLRSNPDISSDMMFSIKRHFKGQLKFAEGDCEYHEHSDLGTAERETECEALESKA